MSEKLSVQAQVPEKKDASGKVTQAQVGPFTITVDAGATASECISMFGDAAVKTNALANWVVTLQGNMRAKMKKGATQAQLQAELGSAKMGVAVKAAPIDPKAQFIALYQASTPEQREKLIAELRGSAAKK